VYDLNYDLYDLKCDLKLVGYSRFASQTIKTTNN